MNENWIVTYSITVILFLIVAISILSQTISDLRIENDRLTQQLCQYENCSYKEINE